MSQVMVLYKVKPDQATRNEELVQRVYGELHQTMPAGLREVGSYGFWGG